MLRFRFKFKINGINNRGAHNVPIKLNTHEIELLRSSELQGALNEYEMHGINKPVSLPAMPFSLTGHGSVNYVPQSRDLSMSKYEFAQLNLDAPANQGGAPVMDAA